MVTRKTIAFYEKRRDEIGRALAHGYATVGYVNGGGPAGRDLVTFDSVFALAGAALGAREAIERAHDWLEGPSGDVIRTPVDYATTYREHKEITAALRSFLSHFDERASPLEETTDE